MTELKTQTPLRQYTNGDAVVAIQGPNVGTVMRNLGEQIPAIKGHLFSSDGELPAFVNLFLGEDNIQDLQKMQTPLHKGDILRLIPSIAGGSGK